jgi:hypothetical protein
MHGADCELLRFARAFEQATTSRAKPPVTPELPTDIVAKTQARADSGNGQYAPPKLFIMEPYVDGRTLHMSGTLNGSDGGADGDVQVFVNGKSVAPAREGFAWSVAADVEPFTPETPLYGGYSVHVGKVNIVVIARGRGGITGEVLSVGP